MDIQLQAGWRPTLAAVEKIARQLLEVLSYLLVKKVVHRTLSLGTIVRNEHDDVKLISLGHSKYIGKLDYEEKVQRFAQEWRGVVDDGAGRDRASHFSPRSSAQTQNKTTENEEDPTLQTQNKKTKKYDCAHPASRCILFCFAASTFLMIVNNIAHEFSHFAATNLPLMCMIGEI
jgi:serine/threonine protein kinase